MQQRTMYEDHTWNPLVADVVLTDIALRVGSHHMIVTELHAVGMAEAYQRGRWLGGGGSERPLAELPDGPGVVPVIRGTGAARPVKVRRAAEFAHAVGQLALELSGGPDAVAAFADQARREGVPLWIPRRVAPGPLGPIMVAVERRLVRADVWGPMAPVIRLRGPYGLAAGREAAAALRVTVGDQPAAVSTTEAFRKANRSVSLRAEQGRWELWRADARSSRLMRDGAEVARLTRPVVYPGGRLLLLPLADVRLASDDPLDAVMAQFFAVAFGLGDATGAVRFGARRPLPGPNEPRTWSSAWYTGLGSSGFDSGPGGGHDGWGGGGGGGGDGGWGGGGDGGGGGGGGGA